MVCWQAGSFSPATLPMWNALKGCRQVFLSAGTWQLMSPSWTPCDLLQPQDSETASHPGDVLWIWCYEKAGNKLAERSLSVSFRTCHSGYMTYVLPAGVPETRWWSRGLCIWFYYFFSWLRPSGYIEGERGKKVIQLLSSKNILCPCFLVWN